MLGGMQASSCTGCLSDIRPGEYTSPQNRTDDSWRTYTSAAELHTEPKYLPCEQSCNCLMSRRPLCRRCGCQLNNTRRRRSSTSKPTLAALCPLVARPMQGTIWRHAASFNQRGCVENGTNTSCALSFFGTCCRGAIRQA